MKKFAGITVAGLGVMAAGFAAPSQAAAPTTHISGNFQYTSMQYYCNAGTPNFVFAYRTLNKTEAKVTFSASGYRDLVDNNVSPYTASQAITAKNPVPGETVTIHALGSSTGSSFSVSGVIPASCKGLPNVGANIDWASQGRPTAQPVPSTTSSAPTKSSTSAPTKTTPVPTKSTSTSAPVKTTTPPAPVKTAPATSMPPAPAPSSKGPKVDTDRVPTSNDSTLYAMAAGAGAIAVAGAGSVAVRRRK